MLGIKNNDTAYQKGRYLVLFSSHLMHKVFLATMVIVFIVRLETFTQKTFYYRMLQMCSKHKH